MISDKFVLHLVQVPLYSTSHVYTTQNCISIGARRDNNLIEEDDTSLKLHGVISFLFGF